jgi:hypothetical protein
MPPDIAPYLNYGVLGLTLLALMTGRFRLAREVEAAEAKCALEGKRADKAEAELDRIREKLEQDVVPLLTRAVDVVGTAELRRRS